MSDKFNAEVQEARIVTVPVLLVKPHTYMNRSGESIRKVVDFYKLNPADQLIVINDEIDLPFGELRFRMNGGPGTHNGLKSIVEQLGEGFPRIRLGVGTPQHGEDLANWILSAFTPEEMKGLQKMIETVPDLVKKFVVDGPPK